MSQENQTGFFRQYFIACFQPGKYNLLLEKKTGSHVLYLGLLLLFLLVVDTLIPFGAWTASVGGFRNLFMNRIPEFTLDNGTLTMESPLSFEIGSSIRVEINSGVEKYTQEDFDEEYLQEILVSKTNVLIRRGETGSELSLSELSLSALSGLYLDNQVLTAAIPAIMVMLLFYFIMIFISKAVQYLIVSLVYGLICRVGVRSPEGETLSIKDSFLIAVYAKTLFAIIGSVNASLGYIISSFWVSMISIVFVMSYMFKAEVSVLKPEVS